MKHYLLRLMFSPRWAWLKRLLGPYMLIGDHANQWIRIVMNQETKKLIQELDPGSKSALEISGTNWQKAFPFQQYRSVFLTEHDICKAPLPETYDLVFAEQVFEHLLYPYRAGKNVYQMLKPGGHFLVTTPFLIRIHDDPVDCTRWTETGLRYFLAECGFPLESIRVASWGNRQCAKAHLKPGWPIYQAWKHSLANEPDYPAVVWALAKKEG